MIGLGELLASRLLSAVENVIVAPVLAFISFISFISFVCSVGNVPLAAAL